jgi:hypothetical protein
VTFTRGDGHAKRRTCTERHRRTGADGGRDHRRLNAQDNVTAGVVQLDRLTGAARLDIAVAGYYQALGGVKKHGMYPDTKLYVKNVLGIKPQLERGWDLLR